MKRKSILLVLCIGMILTSCESKISLNSTDVKNEKNQKNTTMENPDKGYNLPIDEDKKKEAVNDCEEIMGIIRDIYSEYNGIQEADQNTAEQMMNRMKEIIKQNGNPVIGSDHYSVMDNYQKMEQFLKSAEQEEKGSVILYEADADGGITRKEYSYDGKEMSVMSAKMIWSEDTEPVLTYISLSKIKEWAYTENGNFCYELCVPEPPEVTEIVDGSCIIRVKPLSEECREYSKKYVSTFGYQGNNLLCSNWNAEDMQGLDYNGLYEYFYQMKYGEKFTAEKEVVGIPAEEFENVIMTYLPVTKEELKDKSIPMYKSGPANLDTNYRQCYDGEDLLTDFLKTYLQIPNVQKFDSKKNKWVMVETPADSEARLDHVADFFKGNFKELKDALKMQPNNQVKVLIGVKTTNDNRQFQDVFIQKVLHNNATKYTALESALQEKKDNGAYPNTEFEVCSLKEYGITPTNFGTEQTQQNQEDLPW